MKITKRQIINSEKHIKLILELNKDDSYKVLSGELEKIEGKLNGLIAINNITFTVFVFVIAFRPDQGACGNWVLILAGLILLLSTTTAISWNFSRELFSTTGATKEKFFEKSYIKLISFKRKYRLASHLKVLYMGAFFAYGIVYFTCGI